MKNGKRVVITYGTFDLFHIGHINILDRARSLGDFLIVAVSTDAFNAVKGKKSFFNFNDRRRIIESCRYVDKVIPENDWGQKESDIRENGVDVFVMGDDWTGKFDHLESICDVQYLPRTPNISSTQVRMLSGAVDDSKIIQDIKKANHILSTIINRFENIN